MVLCLPVRAVFAADAEADRITRLEAAVRALQRQNEALAGELARMKAAGPAAGGKAAVDDVEARRVTVLPAGKETKLVIGGFIHGQAEFGDAGAYSGRFPGGVNDTDDRFRVRRARLSVSGEFLEDFDFKLDGEFTQGDGIGGGRTAFSGADLFINWHALPEANVRAGQFKAPLGMEMLTPATKLLTIERSLASEALTPQRQIGVQIWGRPLASLAPGYADRVSYAAGVFNGNGRNTNTNDNSEFMWTGRLEAVPFTGRLGGLDSSVKIGGNALWSRDEAGTNISPSGALRLGADGSLSAFPLPVRDERFAWGADVVFAIGSFDLRAEYLRESVRPRGAAGAGFREFDASGYYVQAAFFLVPGKLQMVAKWESFDPDQAPNDDIRSITGGLNYYLKGDDLKLMLNYIHTWSDFRRERPGPGGDQFDQIVARLQVMF